MDQFDALGLTFPAPTAPATRFNWGGNDFENIMVAAANAMYSKVSVVANQQDVTAVPGTVNVTSAAGGQTLLAASAVGRRCIVYNNGANAVTVSDGGTPVAGTTGSFILQPGGYWERPVAAKSAVKGITASGASSCLVTVL